MPSNVSRLSIWDEKLTLVQYGARKNSEITKILYLKHLARKYTSDYSHMLSRDRPVKHAFFHTFACNARLTKVTPIAKRVSRLDYQDHPVSELFCLDV